MDVLVTIKRLVIARHVLFTEKAADEMLADSLSQDMVYEAILNAPSVIKTMRSRNPKTRRVEKLYVIKGLTFDGMAIYTKGKIVTRKAIDIFYVLISSKRSTDV